MKNIQWIFLIYAILAVSTMVAIGVSVSFRSTKLILTFVILLIVIMGLGFQKKKKLRESGKLQ